MTRNKYGNRKVTDDGILFDSLKEHRRYCELRILQRAGKIMGLRVHPTYPISLNDKLICKVILDFTYFDCDKGIHIYEDVKGGRVTMTQLSRLKHKLFEAQSNEKVSIV